MSQIFRHVVIHLGVVGILLGVFSTRTGIVIAEESTPATRADSSEGEWAPATLIVPGKSLEITEGGALAATVWTIVITRVDQATFHGLADSEWMMGSRSIVSGLQNSKVPFRVQGRILPSGLVFDVYRYHVEEARENVEWSAEGKYSQGKWAIEKAQYKQKKKAYLGLGKHISREAAEQQDASRRQAVEQGIKDWQAIRPTVAELRSQGHFIDTYGGILTDGTVNLSWSDETYVDSPRGQTVKRLTDYSIMSGLPKLERLTYMRFSRPMPKDAWEQVRKLRHIGSINFIGSTATRGVSTLAGGPTIGALNVSGADNKIIRELSKLDRVKGMWIQLDRSEASRAGLNIVTPLTRMTGLRELQVSNPPEDDVGAIFFFLRDLEQLEALSVPVGVSNVGIANLQLFKKLKSLRIGKMAPQYLASFTHPTLEHLQIAHSEGMGDAHLEGWKLPPALKSLQLPYWIPGDHLAFVKRFPEMSAREHACYEIVRILPEMYAAYEKAAYGRVQLEALAGMFVYARKVDEIPQARTIADNLLNSDQSNRRETQRILRTNMQELADLTLDVSSKLVAERRMPLANALIVQKAVYPYCGTWNQQFKNQLTPLDITVCEQQYESLKAVLRELRQ